MIALNAIRELEATDGHIDDSRLSGRRPRRGLGSYIHEQFAEIGGVDLETSRSSEPAPAADFSA